MPYRRPQKKKKKPNGLFSTGGNWTVKSCEVYDDVDEFSQCFVNGKKFESSRFPRDGNDTTKSAQFSQCFVNGEKVEGSQFQHDFENFMHFEFDDDATDNVNKKTVKRSYMEMELVQEPKQESCCLIL